MTAIAVWSFSFIFIAIRYIRTQRQMPESDTSKLWLAAGMLSLLCGIAINRFAAEDDFFAMVSVFFFVISAIANVVYIRKVSVSRN